MACYVLGFQEIDQPGRGRWRQGAHLGELSRIEGLRVPAGFCVTTDAFQRIMAEAPSIDDRLSRLSRTTGRRSARSARRSAGPSKGSPSPTIWRRRFCRLARLGEQAAYAVRSSATAEDLPTASFAGQQDTYLNVVGPAAILQRQPVLGLALHRAGRDYRLRNGFDHRGPHGRGRAADGLPAGGRHPVHGRPRHRQPEGRLRGGQLRPRRGPGLGLVNADVYKVRDGEVVAKAVATKQLAIRLAGRRDAGTGDRAGAAGAASADGCAGRAARAAGPADRSALRRPQDIEWCLVDDDFQIVQSRPITRCSHPAHGDRENRVYVSVGHQQMMTDPIAPGALPVAADGRPAHVRGRREAVRRRHPGPGFASEPRRPPGAPGEIRSADRGRAADHPRTRRLHPVAPGRGPGRAPAGGAPAPIETDPAIVAEELIGRSQASIAALKRDIPTKSGSALLDFILADIQELKRILFDPQSHQVIMAAMEATWWLNEHCRRGWARRTRPTRSRSPSPTTSRRRWGWRSWMSRT